MILLRQYWKVCTWQQDSYLRWLDIRKSLYYSSHTTGYCLQQTQVSCNWKKIMILKGSTCTKNTDHSVLKITTHVITKLKKTWNKWHSNPFHLKNMIIDDKRLKGVRISSFLYCILNINRNSWKSNLKKISPVSDVDSFTSPLHTWCRLSWPPRHPMSSVPTILLQHSNA